MALINFGPGPSDDSDYNKLLLQEFQKKIGQRDKRDRKGEGKGMMQGGSNAEGILNIVNSALHGYIDGETERAQLRAAQGQQQAAVDAARSNIGGSASAGASGASGGTSGGSAGGGSRSSGRQAVADAYYSPDKPAPTMAAGDLSRTMTLPPEVAGDPVAPGPTAFGDPAALGGPGMANPEMAVIPKALPPEMAGDATGREGVVAAMLPNLEAAPGPRINTANWTPEDRDMAIRTTYGEASNQGAVGQQAVASVIANRSASSGMTPTQVVLAKGQFEPWMNDEARARMQNLKPDSPEYQRIAANLQPLFEGRIPDPTGGATHFYAPRAQAALGRNKPSWDDGSGNDIGDHRFFRLQYGGGGKDGRERVRTAALEGGNTVSDADPVAPVAGDNPAVLRRDATAYDKSNPEAARQLRVRADVAEAIARGEKPPVPLVKPGSRSVATPVEAAPPPATPVEVAQAPMAPLPSQRGAPGDLRDLTIDDIAPGFSARRDKIAAGLNSTNPYVRNQALGEYNAMQKELPELQKKLAEINATNRRTVYSEGNQNFRHGQTLGQQRVEEGGRNTRHGIDTQVKKDEETGRNERHGLDLQQKETEETGRNTRHGLDLEQKERQYRHNVPPGTTVLDSNGKATYIQTPEEREYDAYLRSQNGAPGAAAKPLSKSQWQAQRDADREEALTQAKGRTEQLTKLAGTAGEASANLATIKHLHTLISDIDPGSKTAALEAIRGATGIALDPNADKVQAANAIMSYMMPRMRVEGSGSSSDRDMSTFGKALPSLLGTPEGNALVTNTLGGLAQKQADRAEIASQYLRGEIGSKEAMKNIAAIDKQDSFAAFREWQKANPGKETPAPRGDAPKADPAKADPPAPAGVDAKLWKHMTPEERRLFGGK